MAHMRITDKADLQVMFEAERARYTPEKFAALGVTIESVTAYYQGVPSIGYEIDGVMAGGAIFENNELHFAVLPQYYGRWAWLMKPTLDWLFTMSDSVLGKVEIFNIRCAQFLDAGGWPRVAQDEQYITYLFSSKNNDIFRRHRDRLARDMALAAAARANAEAVRTGDLIFE